MAYTVGNRVLFSATTEVAGNLPFAGAGFLNLTKIRTTGAATITADGKAFFTATVAEDVDFYGKAIKDLAITANAGAGVWLHYK